MIEKTTVKGEAVFNESRTHRYLLSKVWDKNKPVACVIMLNPAMADNIIMDTTTALVVNNIASLEKFGGVIVVNLYSVLTSKLKFRWNSDDDLNAPENDGYIKKAAEECDTVILAWGRATDTNLRIAERTTEVINLLIPYKEKLCQISDGERSGLHPLTPSVRSARKLRLKL